MNISLELVGLTFSTAGEILLAVTVLTVHSKLKKEHRIDKLVEREINFEHAVGFLAIFCMVVGYLLQVRFFNLLVI